MQAEPIVSGYNFSVEMERKYYSHLNLCVTNFSIAVIKYDDQSNLQEQEFIYLWFKGIRVHHVWEQCQQEVMAAEAAS